jgi:hypothetical protein
VSSLFSRRPGSLQPARSSLFSPAGRGAPVPRPTATNDQQAGRARWPAITSSAAGSIARPAGRLPWAAARGGPTAVAQQARGILVHFRRYHRAAGCTCGWASVLYRRGTSRQFVHKLRFRRGIRLRPVQALQARVEAAGDGGGSAGEGLALILVAKRVLGREHAAPFAL